MLVPGLLTKNANRLALADPSLGSPSLSLLAWPGSVFGDTEKSLPLPSIQGENLGAHTHLDPFVSISLLYDLQPLTLRDGQLILTPCLGPTRKESRSVGPLPQQAKIPTHIHT